MNLENFKIPTGHIPQLDGIRAIAALMVMYFHFFEWHNIEGSFIKNLIQRTSLFGQTGVSLFFLLSGFLITRILLSTKNEPNYFKNFYVKRILRIAPLYYFFLLIYYYIMPLIYGGEIAALKDQLIYYTYLQNIFITFSSGIKGPGHFWSLGVEEHFYLFWPLLVYLVNNKKLILWLIGLICLSIVSRIILISMNYEVFYFTLTRLDDISFGAMLAVISIQYPDLIKYFKGKRIIAFSTLFFLIVLLLWYFASGKADFTMQILKFVIIGIIYFIFLGYAVFNNNRFIRIFTTKPLIYLGKISYGLYVYHGLCHSLMLRFLPLENIYAQFIAFFVISILISILSFELFEKHFLKLKRYFNPKGRIETIHKEVIPLLLPMEIMKIKEK